MLFVNTFLTVREKNKKKMIYANVQQNTVDDSDSQTSFLQIFSERSTVFNTIWRIIQKDRWRGNYSHIKSQVAQAHYESREQHYPPQLINFSYSKKIIRRCMEKYSLLTKLAKCTLNIALKLTFSVFLFFFVF